jgi:branched-chain amino acid transport system substrate-binding protein
MVEESVRRNAISRVSAVAIVLIIIIATVALILYSGILAQRSSSSYSQSTTQQKQIQVVFGATLSMSGPLQAFGQEQNWTYWYAANMVNSLGGIPLSNGSRALIKLVIFDDKTDPNVAVSNLQTLVSQYHATIILGELGGIQDSVAASFASRSQVPYIGPVYPSSAKTCTGTCDNSWVFAPFQNETNEAHVFLNWFRSVDPSTPSHNVTIAFFEEGDPPSQANAQAGEEYARKLGYTVCTCSDLTFTPGSTTEMTNFITAAKSAGAEAVFGLPLPPDAVLMINIAHQLNYTPKAWLLTRGTAVAPFAVPALGGLGNLSVGVMSSFPWHPAVPYVGNLLGHNVSNSKIVSDYESYWHHPPTLEGVYFTQVLVAVDAIAKAGSLDKYAIRDALRSTTFQTVMGPVSFTLGGQWIQSDNYILLLQWQNVVVNGQNIQALQILEPKEIATTNYVIYPFSWTNQQHMKWPS